MDEAEPTAGRGPAPILLIALFAVLVYLGMIYLDGGSGAQHPVSKQMIRAVKDAIRVPLITGGGIRTPEAAESALNAGSDIIVVGNAVEKDPGLLLEIADGIRKYTRVHT